MSPGEFKSVFQRLYMPLCMYSLRILGSDDDAADVVQEVFAGVWSRVGEGGEIPAPGPYLYRAVRNASLNRLRSRRDTVGLDSLDEVAGDAEVAPEVMERAERDAMIWRAVDSLPAKCREVFLLSKRDGLANKEIAGRLGISVKTVENQITKAFRKLRGDLGSLPLGSVFFLPFL